MTEITIYRANDGTDFEDEWDCKQYEWEQSCDDATYSLLDIRYKVLPPKDPNSYEDAFFIFIPSREAAFSLYNNWDTDIISMDCPSFLPWRAEQNVELGLWAWDEDNEKWFHLGKKVDELSKMADKAMRAINGV